ncbi:MAG: hypothetical protein QM817_26600 [Archangium sp.]
MPEPRTTSPVAAIIAAVVLVLLMAAICLVLGSTWFFSMRAPPRAMTSEVKSNLKYAFTSQKANEAEHDVFSDTIDPLGFLPERNNRYLYAFSNGCDFLLPGFPDGGAHCGVLADETRIPPPDNALLKASLTPWLSDIGIHCGEDGGACWTTIFAAGNLDSDSTVDVWSISTRERVIAGETVAAGTPFNHVDDLTK